MIDLDAFAERAAIMEFDGAMPRFVAETKAAEEQGKRRFEVLDEIRERNSARRRNNGSQVARQSRQDDVPGVQPTPKEKNRSVSEHNPKA